VTWRVMVLTLLWLLSCAQPADAATLSRGVNITNWFRYPPSRDSAVLARYLSDQALAGLHAAGFDFVRLAIDPDVVAGAGPSAVLIAAIRRIEAHGMAVIVSPHPRAWNLEISAADRERLRAFWRDMAPKLAALDQARTVPEVLNEPVFPNDPAAWAALQHLVLVDIRSALPHATVMLTGQDWGSIGGLLALTPEADRNVVYSVHFYDPAELTSLAAYRHDVDHVALRLLPFPAETPSRCAAMAADQPTRDLMQYYCSLGWDAERIAVSIDRALAWSRRYDVRLVVGEFGASAELNTTARLAWLTTVRSAFDVRHLGWALWGYDDIMGFALKPPPDARPMLDPGVLSALGMAALGMAAAK